MYKKISIVLFLIILALIGYYNFYITEPQIGVIDMNKLLKQSIRAEELQKNLEEVSRELEKKYEDVSEEDTDLQERKNQIQIEYNQSKQEMEERLNNEIEVVIDEINKNNKYSVILYKERVYQGGKDITQKVIDLLDEKYSQADQNE